MKLRTHLTTDSDARRMLDAIARTPLVVAGDVGDAVAVETDRHGVIFRAIWKDAETVLVSMAPDFFKGGE